MTALVTQLVSLHAQEERAFASFHNQIMAIISFPHAFHGVGTYDSLLAIADQFLRAPVPSKVKLAAMALKYGTLRTRPHEAQTRQVISDLLALAHA